MRFFHGAGGLTHHRVQKAGVVLELFFLRVDLVGAVLEGLQVALDPRLDLARGAQCLLQGHLVVLVLEGAKAHFCNQSLDYWVPIWSAP